MKQDQERQKQEKRGEGEREPEYRSFRCSRRSLRRLEGDRLTVTTEPPHAKQSAWWGTKEKKRTQNDVPFFNKHHLANPPCAQQQRRDCRRRQYHWTSYSCREEENSYATNVREWRWVRVSKADRIKKWYEDEYDGSNCTASSWVNGYYPPS